jgi:hypothetical protein
MSKGRKGRTPDQILKDREEIARLYLQRMTQREIGERLGLSRQQVGYDLEAIRQEWLKSSLVNFDARRAEELARIDRMEREYWDAWETSKKEKETTTSEQVNKGGGEQTKAAIRKVEQTGDPRYLAGVERCVDRRCKLLGLNAPLEIRDVSEAQLDAEIHRLLGKLADQRQDPVDGPPPYGGPEPDASVEPTVRPFIDIQGCGHDA